MLASDTRPPAPAPERGFINPVDGRRVSFPPFPEPALGTTIMSFKEFKEGGIRVDPGPNDEEVDSHGIPTIPLPKRHAADACKTNTKRKRQHEEATARKKAGLSTQRLWWDQWEDTEAIRFSTAHDPRSSRFEKLHAAASDFTNGRSWPVNFASETGPKFIWEKFKKYLGIPEGSIVPQDKGKAGEHANGDDEMSDDEVANDDEEDANEPISTNAIVADRDLPAMLAKGAAMASNEEKLSLFFDDPELSFKVFMTSHAREMGYIWYDANLDCMPRVLLFFVNFLLRSKVLREIDRELRRSVDVLKLAITELPNTSKIAKSFPDKLSLACIACWDRKAEGYKPIQRDDPIETTTASQPLAITDKEQPDVAMLETDTTAASNKETTSTTEPDTPWGASKAEGSGWGTSEAESAAWSTGSWGPTAATAVDKAAEAEAFSAWFAKDKEDALLDFLGPTALPLTHRPGIVERSMRRITAILPPNPNPPKSAPLGEDASEPNPEAVEVDLDRQFTKLVLSPVEVDWDGGECPVYAEPVILDAPQAPGPAVNAAGAEKSAAPVEGTTPGAIPKVHNPLEDNITLLIENKEPLVSQLRVGLLLGGTWVQLVRQGEVVKKKKKGKSKKVVPNYWYMDEFGLTTPSFWAIPAK